MQFCCWNLAVSKDNYCYDLPYYFVWIKYIYIFVIGNIECVSIWTSMLIKAPLNFMLDVNLWMDLSIDLICFLLWLVLLLYNTSVLHDIKLNINIPNFIYMYCLRQVCVCATLPPWSACTVHLICQHCCIMIHKPLLISHIFNKQTTNRWESKVEKPGFAARCGEWSASKVWSPVTAPRSSLPLQSEGQTVAYLGQREAYL